MSGVTFPKTWADGETLTHTDLNGNYTAINTAVGAASGIASLNSSSLVVEDPANATATKAAGKICKWGTSEAFQCSALTATTISGSTITGSGVVQGTQITSTIADGTAPLVVTSTTEVANLKAASATTATQVTDGTNNIKTKIVNLGDWDMDATASLAVAHGLTHTSIRSVSAIIRSDDDATCYPVTPGIGTANSAAIESIDSTNVNMTRYAGGIFDNTGFNSTSFNRGWVTIIYTV